MSRRAALAAVLVAALAAVAALGATHAPTNPSALPTGLAAGPAAASSALYCTGLTDAVNGAAGQVLLLNTTRHRRDVTVSVVSDTGRHGGASLSIAPHGTATVTPTALASGGFFGVSAVVDGGGVLADEVTTGFRSEAPCATDGVTQWYGSGFDSTVGSSATLTFFNPTATPAVANVSAYTPTGFAAPPAFQGLSVGAHAEVTVDLGRAVVDVADFGARVNVLRGALVIAGVESSLTVGSIDGGAAAPTTDALFPAVTTAPGAVAQVRLANPGPLGARVTLEVTLGGYQVPSLSVTVPPFGEGEASVTPNSSIPAEGLAVVRVRSSEPVVASLAAGTGVGVALTPATAPTEIALLDWAVPAPSSILVTNVSDGSARVRVERSFTVAGCARASGPPPGVGAARVGAGQSVNASSLPGLSRAGCVVAVVSTSRPTMVVTEVLPSTPAGVAIVSGSAG